jgi:hypothetical protein
MPDNSIASYGDREANRARRQHLGVDVTDLDKTGDKGMIEKQRTGPRLDCQPFKEIAL